MGNQDWEFSNVDSGTSASREVGKEEVVPI
jgi:hypothetical protein